MASKSEFSWAKTITAATALGTVAGLVLPNASGGASELETPSEGLRDAHRPMVNKVEVANPHF